MNKSVKMKIGNDIPTMHAWNSIILGKTAREIGLDARMALLGRLSWVYAKNNDRKGISVGSFYHWMMPAINHEQIRVYLGEVDSLPTGYLMWAWFSDKTLDDYLTNPRFVPHPSQWNEGFNLVMLDICLPNKKSIYLREISKSKTELVKSGVKSIHYCSPETQEQLYSWYNHE